jgi:putative ABC transport system permease protein
MVRFAWLNLLTRPLRTALAMVGLSVPILGVIGLFTVSDGLRNLVGDTLNQIQGLMVVRVNQPSPVFSDLKMADGEAIRKVPGVRVVAPEVWKIAPPVENQNLILQSAMQFARGDKNLSILDAPVIQGQDIPAHEHLETSVYRKALKTKGEGRFLEDSDRGTKNIVISRKIAKMFANADGKPKHPGDTLRIGKEAFPIIGIYETGSMFLDVVIVMDIDTARKVVNVADDFASSFYVELDYPEQAEAMSARIEQALSTVDARSMSEFAANFGVFMSQLDTFLLMTVSLALLVGVVGIVNTMLMSTTERFVEFGVLRTNGWTRGDVLRLVTLESAYLGLLSGAIGCLLGLIGVTVVNQFLEGGLVLRLTPKLVAMGIGLSVVTGTLGGLYPAWKASRLVPMDAIRLGSH